MSRRVSRIKEPSIPPELDVTSDCFDPKKFLEAENVILPYPNAKTYNNLAEYYSHTFLLKDNRKKNIAKEVPQKRNYAWYYSTIGYDPSYGNDYYDHMNKQFNNRKRKRKGKKSAHTSIIPCEPMRSGKVVNIKSDYKLYCRKKFPKWFKEFASSYEANLDDETSKPPMSLDEFVVRIFENADVEGTSISFPQNDDEMRKWTGSESQNRNVLLKFDKNTDPLLFLKCIIFGKVDTDRPLSFSMNRTGEPRTFDLPLPLFAQSPGFVPDASTFLCSDPNPVGKSDSSAYETESSGYMSDCSEIDRLKALYASKRSRLDSTQAVMKSENAGRLGKQIEVTVHNNVLKAKENIPSLGILSEEGGPAAEKTEDSDNFSIIVSIDRKLITVRNLKVRSAEKSNLKENKLPVGCKCNTAISKELSCQCTCGFYNSAVNAIRNFKIPRKRAINSSTTKSRVNKKAK